jgi:hypothetical protein
MTVASKRIDERTLESVYKVDGRIVSTVRSVISSDGKTMTTTSTGEMQGKRFTNVIVYRKTADIGPDPMMGIWQSQPEPPPSRKKQGQKLLTRL